jgi:phosphohistidine phosphatase
MRRLTLIRHAKSSWDDPALPDFERPLNARGKRDAPAMAKRLAAELERPLELVSSPAHRAAATAQVFAAALGATLEDIRYEPRLYEASAERLLEIVRGFDDADLHVLVFGHNPGLSELARTLADCPFEEMPTCAAATLSLAVRRWQDVRAGCGRLERYRYPKQTQR